MYQGLHVAMFGKADMYKGALQMTNPIVDLIGDRTGRIVPIYPQSEKANVSTWELAGWIENALERCKVRGLLDPVPQQVDGFAVPEASLQALAGVREAVVVAQPLEQALGLCWPWGDPEIAPLLRRPSVGIPALQKSH